MLHPRLFTLGTILTSLPSTTGSGVGSGVGEGATGAVGFSVGASTGAGVSAGVGAGTSRRDQDNVGWRKATRQDEGGCSGYKYSDN